MDLNDAFFFSTSQANNSLGVISSGCSDEGGSDEQPAYASEMLRRKENVIISKFLEFPD